MTGNKETGYRLYPVSFYYLYKELLQLKYLISYSGI